MNDNTGMKWSYVIMALWVLGIGALGLPWVTVSAPDAFNYHASLIGFNAGDGQLFLGVMIFCAVIGLFGFIFTSLALWWIEFAGALLAAGLALYDIYNYSLGPSHSSTVEGYAATLSPGVGILMCGAFALVLVGASFTNAMSRLRYPEEGLSASGSWRRNARANRPHDISRSSGGNTPPFSGVTSASSSMTSLAQAANPQHTTQSEQFVAILSDSATTPSPQMAPPRPTQPPAPSVAPAPPGTPPSWLPDPIGRFEHRYWDGGKWTEHVSNQGVMSVDFLR